MTMDAIIIVNSSVHAFHLFRTSTNAHIAESRRVSTVELRVMIREFPNTLQKCIFFIAFGKFFVVKPCLPINASG